MSCKKIKNGFICLPNIYKYKGFVFEWLPYCGPLRLKKDFEPAERQGEKFYNVVAKWDKLNKIQKEKTKIYG